METLDKLEAWVEKHGRLPRFMLVSSSLYNEIIKDDRYTEILSNVNLLEEQFLPNNQMILVDDLGVLNEKPLANIQTQTESISHWIYPFSKD